MGGSNSVEFLADQESPSGTGEKVVMSSPIDGVQPADFWKGLEQWVREREPRSKSYETGLLRQDLPDGRGLRLGCHIETTGIAAKIFPFKGTLNVVYRLPPVNNELYIHYHHLDCDCKSASKCKEFLVKLHEDGTSFRIECKGVDFKVRRHGPILASLTETFLKDVGYTGVDVKCDVDSPSTSGQLSVVSGIIPEANFTVQKVWETYKSKLLADCSGAEIGGDPNKVVMDRASWNSLHNSYCILHYDEENAEFIQYEYGSDEALQDLRSTFHHKFLLGPDGARVESFGWTVDGPCQTSEVKDMIEDTVLEALKYLQPSS